MTEKDKRDPMVSFRMPRQLLRRYHRAAKRAGLSRSKWLRRVIRLALLWENK